MKETKVAAIALIGILHGSVGFAQGSTFTPIEALPPEQRQAVSEQVDELSKTVSIDWDKVVVGVDQDGNIAFANKDDGKLVPMGSFSCAAK